MNFFSKTCRAKFGDKDCGVNLEDYKINCKIQSIDSNVIILESCDNESGYFTGGKVCFANSSKSFIIDQHYNNIIRLSCSVPIDLIYSKNINIYPTCDKDFRTCCKNFNNAVNFRGEPFAPTYINLLK